MSRGPLKRSDGGRGDGQHIDRATAGTGADATERTHQRWQLRPTINMILFNDDACFDPVYSFMKGIDVFCEKGVFNICQSRRILEAGRRAGLRLNFHADELSALGGAEVSLPTLQIPSSAFPVGCTGIPLTYVFFFALLLLLLPCFFSIFSLLRRAK